MVYYYIIKCMQKLHTIHTGAPQKRKINKLREGFVIVSEATHTHTHNSTLRIRAVYVRNKIVRMTIYCGSISSSEREICGAAFTTSFRITSLEFD